MAKAKATTTRPVHYAAHGTGGLAFDCFHRDLRVHIASEDPTAPVHDRWRTRTVPSPRRHTDLRCVTCPECWAAIAAMAAGRRAG